MSVTLYRQFSIVTFGLVALLTNFVFKTMSSKKNNRWRSCPGCKTATVDHSFGPLSKYCTGPDTEENIDGAVDAARSCGACSQAQPTQSILMARKTKIKSSLLSHLTIGSKHGQYTSTL